MLRRILVVIIVGALGTSVMSAGALAVPRARFVQVVAHPDDDVVFMNPDLTTSVTSGSEVTSVYVTSGESDVQPGEQYAAQRRAGTRAAFARMARAPDVWESRDVPIAPGRTVRAEVLRDAPQVRLIFLGLPDDNDPRVAGGKHALTRLWEAGATVRTLPGRSPPRSYDRQSLVDTLSAVLRTFAPTTLRTQDPEPDVRYQGQWGRFHDHPDHVVTANLTDAALTDAALPDAAPPGAAGGEAAPAGAVERRSGIRDVRAFHYRDYNTADAVANLPPAAVAEKRDVFARYVPHDREVSMGEPYATWLRSMRYRWERGVRWAERDRWGRLNLVHVAGQRLVAEVRESGRVHRTALSGVVPVEGTASLVRAPGGGLVLVVLSRDRHEVLVKRQDAAGTWQAPWRNIGAPGSLAGAPAVAFNGNGQLVVAGRNDRSGASACVEEGGACTWHDLGGAVDGDVTAVRGAGGSVDLFAPVGGRVRHWVGTTTRFIPEPLPFDARPAGRIVLARGSTGTAFAAYREFGTSQVVVLARKGNHWSRVDERESSGNTAPALVVSGGRPLLAVTDARGRVTVSEPAGPAVAAPGGGMVDQLALTANSLVVFRGDAQPRRYPLSRFFPAHARSPPTSVLRKRTGSRCFSGTSWRARNSRARNSRVGRPLPVAARRVRPCAARPGRSRP